MGFFTKPIFLPALIALSSLIEDSTGQLVQYDCGQCNQLCPNQSEEERVNYNQYNNICTDTRFHRLSEYVAGARHDFYYSSIWNENCQVSGVGYWHLGTLAWIAKNQLPGTVPLIDYWNGANNRISSTALTEPGWKEAATMGYVFNSKVPGTFDLILFQKGATWKLGLEYDQMSIENLGFTKVSVLGYTYKPCPSLWIP